MLTAQRDFYLLWMCEWLFKSTELNMNSRKDLLASEKSREMLYRSRLFVRSLYFRLVFANLSEGNSYLPCKRGKCCFVCCNGASVKALQPLNFTKCLVTDSAICFWAIGKVRPAGWCPKALTCCWWWREHAIHRHCRCHQDSGAEDIPSLFAARFWIGFPGGEQGGRADPGPGMLPVPWSLSLQLPAQHPSEWWAPRLSCCFGARRSKLSSSGTSYSCWPSISWLKAGHLGEGLRVNISSQHLFPEEVILLLEEVALHWEGLVSVVTVVRSQYSFTSRACIRCSLSFLVGSLFLWLLCFFQSLTVQLWCHFLRPSTFRILLFY